MLGYLLVRQFGLSQRRLAGPSVLVALALLVVVSASICPICGSGGASRRGSAR
jgi:hypothetical protein